MGLCPSYIARRVKLEQQANIHSGRARSKNEVRWSTQPRMARPAPFGVFLDSGNRCLSCPHHARHVRVFRMRIAKAAHLMVLAIAFVATLAVASSLLNTVDGRMLNGGHVTAVLVEAGVFIYLVMALSLLVYALIRRSSLRRRASK